MTLFSQSSEVQKEAAESCCSAPQCHQSRFFFCLCSALIWHTVPAAWSKMVGQAGLGWGCLCQESNQLKIKEEHYVCILKTLSESYVPHLHLYFVIWD